MDKPMESMLTYLARMGQNSALAGSVVARLRYFCMFLMDLGRRILGAALQFNFEKGNLLYMFQKI